MDCQNGTEGKTPASMATGAAATAKRTASALTTAAIVVAGFIYAPVWVIATVLGIVAIAAQIEFYRMTRKAAMPAFPILGALCGIGLLSVTYGLFMDVATVTAGFSLILLSIAAILTATTCSKDGNPVLKLAITLLGIVYIPFMLAFSFALLEPSCCCGVTAQNCYILLFAIATVKVADMGGFAFGKAFGRHKMCPSVSPKKSWEGLAGSIFAAATISICFAVMARKLGWDTLNEESCDPVAFWEKLDIWKAAIWGVIAACGGTAGDLLESKIKRTCGVKDSSDFLPAGMGGFLDTVDSLIFAPVLLIIFFELFM